MSNSELDQFKVYLTKFLNEELSEDEWLKFDTILESNKDARDLYRRAISMEIDLEEILKKGPEKIQHVPDQKFVEVSKSYNPLILIAALVFFALVPFAFIQIELPKRKSNIPEYVTQESFAIVTEVEKVFKDLSDHKIELYRTVGREKISFKSGKVRLEYYNGAIVELTGPCEFFVQSEDRSFLQAGTVSAKITPESQGFQIFSPGVSLVDLGTEFSLNVDKNQRTHVHVFEGEAEVSLLNERGETVQSASVFGREGMSLDPVQQTIRSVKDFKAERVKRKNIDQLPFKKQIMEIAKADSPIYQWSLEDAAENKYSQTVGDGHRLKPLPTDGKHATWLSEKPLQNFEESEFSIELWFNANSIHRGALLSLLKAKSDQTFEDWNQVKNIHFLYIELESNAKDAMHSGGCVRFLVRSPSNIGGGFNLFSQKKYIPGNWHHIVATCNSEKMELYMDGVLQSSYVIDKELKKELFFAYVGALSADKYNSRNFIGQLDGLSVYNKKLSAETVKAHYLAKFSGS